MGYKYTRLPDPTDPEDEGEEVDWDKETSSAAYKSMNPGQKARFAKAFHEVLRSDDNSTRPEKEVPLEEFVQHTVSKQSGKEPSTKGEKVALWGMEKAERWLPSVLSKETREGVHKSADTIHEWAGDVASDPKSGIIKKVGAGAVDLGAGIGETAMEYGTSPLDFLVPPGGGIVSKVGGKVGGMIGGRVGRVARADLGAVNLGKAADYYNFKGGVLPKDYFPSGTSREGALFRGRKQIPVGERSLAKQAMEAKAKAPAPSRGALPAGAKAPKPLLEKPVGPKVEEPLVAPGSDPMGSPEAMQRAEMAAQAPKAPIKTVDTEAAVKAEQARRPLSDAKEFELGEKMAKFDPKMSDEEWVAKYKSERNKMFLSTDDLAAAAKAGEAELRMASKDPAAKIAARKAESLTRTRTADEVAAEAKFDSDTATAMSGKVPVDPPKPKLTSLWERFRFKTTKKVIDKNIGLKVMKFDDLHDTITQGPSKNIGVFDEDAKPVISALAGNLNDASEMKLMDSVYKLRSINEVWENTGLSYGGIGPTAAKKLEVIKNTLIAAGKEEKWNRISKSVEEFADATHSIGLERAKAVVGQEVADAWGKKYRYYTSFQNFDTDTAKFVYGEEGVVRGVAPSMEDYATGFTKTREGGEIPVGNIFENWQKSHWTKILAGYKKGVIDKAVKRSHELYGSGLEKEYELAGGKGWAKYTTSDGVVHPMPDVIVDYLTSASPKDVSLFETIAQHVNPFSRRGYLDLNIKYYSGMGLRDIADIGAFAPGYLTPQTQFIAEKLGAAVGIKQNVPNLEYILNPAPWLRGLKASFRVNFGYHTKTSDAIFEALSKQGTLQGGTIEHVMRAGKMKALFPEGATGLVKKIAQEVWEGMGNIMKAWDDTIRIGNYLRNTPPELRGLKNMMKVWKLEHLPEGPMPTAKASAMVRNLNIDFGMSGEWTKSLRALNPFINPAFQDKYRTIQYAKNQPVSFALTTAALMSAATASYLKWKATPEGDKLNPRDTQRFILVDTGIRSKEGGVYAIPAVMIPDSLQGIWLIIRNALDVFDQKDPELKAILKKNYLKKTVSNVAGSLANLSGPMVSAFETLVGWSFYQNRQIEGQYDKNLGAEFRAGKNVPNIHRWMGKKFGISPDKSSYLTRGLLGAPGIAAAESADPLFAKHISLPREGSEQYGTPMDILKRKIGALPKTMGLVREQNYDKRFEETQEFLEGPLTKGSNTRHIIRKYGERYGQEKDPELKKKYLDRAREMYRKYIDGLKPEDKGNVVEFSKVFGQAVKESAESAVTGNNKTMKSYMKKFPDKMRRMEPEKEEEQAP